MNRSWLFASACLCTASPAFAQDAAAPAPADEATTATADAGIGDIVVTARKRSETSIGVPVVISAVSEQQIQNKALDRLEKISRGVPGLLITPTTTVQGGVISIRGVSSSEANPFADQSVSFNVDGAQIGRATVARLGQFDMAQIEVLKGPQALFFGKNSPGGIISVRSADPTGTLAAKLSGGYEFVGNEARVDGYVSGPLTETLGARFAFYGSRINGWVDNIAPATGITAPSQRSGPRSREYAGRLTLKFQPSDVFDARLKVAFNHLRTGGPGETLEIIYCQNPNAPQYGFGATDCRANGENTRGDLGPNMRNVDARYGDGTPFLRARQALTSLESNFHMTDALTLTSVSSYYDLKSTYRDNAVDTANPGFVLGSFQVYGVKEFGQELRLASDFDGPLNFLTGGYYQHSKLSSLSISTLGATALTVLNDSIAHQGGNALSGFGQVMFKPIETVEFSAGGRYSHEKKTFHATSARTLTPLATARDSRSFNNFSPEISASWRPTNLLTVFANYKRGFLSGGFNGGPGNPPNGFLADRSYDQQKTKGFEGGVKALLFDNKLRVNLAAFDYDITGLQVAVLQSTPTGIVTNVANAGKSYSRGIESDFEWKTPIEGLTINGALAYLRARYTDFVGPCYRGQTFEQGCNVSAAGGALGLLQNQTGKALARAPKWAGNLGFNYETPVSSRMKLGLFGSGSYSSQIVTQTDNKPNGVMREYALFDANIRISDVDDKWELALIGNNLSNKYYWSRTSDAALSGRGVNGCHAVSRGVATDQMCPATGNLAADVAAIPSRGREVMLRATIRY